MTDEVAQSPGAHPHTFLKSKASEVLRIGMAVYEPFVFPCALERGGTLARTQHCPKPGFSNEVMAYLMETTNTTYELVFYQDPEDWGTKVPGSPDSCAYTGILGEIINGSIDAMSEYVITGERLECLDFANPTIYSNNVVVYKALSDPTASFTALVRVFSGTVWMACLACVTAYAVLTAATTKIFSVTQEEKSKSIKAQFVEAYSTGLLFIADQSAVLPSTFAQATHTFRYLLSVLGIFAIFFLKLYESGLLTALITPVANRPFRNLQDLSDKVMLGETELVVEATTNYEAYMSDETIGALAAMRAALKSNPLLTAPSNAQGLEMVRQAPAFLTSLSGVQKELDGDCELRYFYEYSLPSVREAYPVPKDRLSALKNALDWEGNKFWKPVEGKLNAGINSALSHTEAIRRRYYAGREQICLRADLRIGFYNLLGWDPAPRNPLQFSLLLAYESVVRLWKMRKINVGRVLALCGVVLAASMVALWAERWLGGRGGKLSASSSVRRKWKHHSADKRPSQTAILFAEEGAWARKRVPPPPPPRAKGMFRASFPRRRRSSSQPSCASNESDTSF